MNNDDGEVMDVLVMTRSQLEAQEGVEEEQ